MDYEIVIAQSALRDLEQIRRYISRDNPDVAQSFCQSLLDKSQTLGRSPYKGVAIPARANGRFVVLKSYLIVYRVVAETRTVRVLRYWHGARDRSRMHLGK